MVYSETGGWRAPTPHDAPALLLPQGAAPAIAVLRQTLGSWPERELDLLTDDLVDIIIEGGRSSRLRVEAKLALIMAAAPEAEVRGIPYDGAFDALVRVYETLAAQALIEGGSDPFAEADRRASYGDWKLRGALRSIYLADVSGRGADYLLAVFHGSEKPPPPCEGARCVQGSAWCAAGYILVSAGIRGRDPLRMLEPPEGGEQLVSEEIASEYGQLCWGGRRLSW